MDLKIGILTTTIRDNRQGLNVAKWALDFANKRNDGNHYEIVDLKDFDLPLFGNLQTEAQQVALRAWSEKINELDGYIVVTAEYNHAPTGVFKNATEFLKPELANKSLGFIGYGGLGGVRAIEILRVAFAEQQLAMVQRSVNFLLAVDFENFSNFKPQPHHDGNAKELFDQVTLWAQALKNVR